MTATNCCGKYNEQYCCTAEEKMQSSTQNNKDIFESTYNQERNPKDNKTLFLIIFVPLIFLLLIGLAVLIFFCHKKRLYAKVPLSN